MSVSPRVEQRKLSSARALALVPTLSVPSKAEEGDVERRGSVPTDEKQVTGLSALQAELRNTDGPNRIEMKKV